MDNLENICSIFREKARAVSDVMADLATVQSAYEYAADPGAPWDSNLCEQSLKKVILHRKNALFYKTIHGSQVGDLFMSLIHTCNLSGINLPHNIAGTFC